MARLLSQPLIRDSCTILSKPSSSLCPSYRLVNSRFRSNSSRRSEKPQIIEVDLGSDSEVEAFGMKRLEDAIHGIIVRRSAPDWLPFVPGSSYWVPPRKGTLSVVELVGRLANPLTTEESLALTTIRGWPSSTYFLEGAAAYSVETNLKTAIQSEDEEG